MKRFERDMPHVARWCNTSTLVDVGYMSCAVALIHEQRGLHPSFRRLRFRAGMWKSCSCVCKIFMIFLSSQVVLNTCYAEFHCLSGHLFDKLQGA